MQTTQILTLIMYVISHLIGCNSFEKKVQGTNKKVYLIYSKTRTYPQVCPGAVSGSKVRT